MREIESAPGPDTFLTAEGELFTVKRQDGTDVKVRLRTVDTSRDRGGEWERFTLRFDPVGDERIGQDLYRIAHPRLPGFDVTLSPTPTADPDPDGVSYEAVFDRHKPERDDRGGPDNQVSRRGILGSLLGVAAGVSLLGNLSGGGSSGPVGAASAAGTEAFIGTIGLFGFGWAPRGWLKCNGQELAISNNQPLFALLGTRYGGDGQTGFKLPDLQGRVPIHAGTGPGGHRYNPGDTGGSAAVSLGTDELPAHGHGHDLQLPVSGAEGEATTPDGNALAAQPDARGTVPNYTGGGTDGAMAVTGSVAETGGSTAHENMPPYQAINYCICTVGNYPPRK